MEKKLEMFRCSRCGNMVEIMNKKQQETPVCCDHPMEHLDIKGDVHDRMVTLVPTDEIQKRILSDLDSIPMGSLEGDDIGPTGLSTNGLMYIHHMGTDGTIEIEVLMNT